MAFKGESNGQSSRQAVLSLSLSLGVTLFLLNSLRRRLAFFSACSADVSFLIRALLLTVIYILTVLGIPREGSSKVSDW